MRPAEAPFDALCSDLLETMVALTVRFPDGWAAIDAALEILEAGPDAYRRSVIRLVPPPPVRAE